MITEAVNGRMRITGQWSTLPSVSRLEKEKPDAIEATKAYISNPSSLIDVRSKGLCAFSLFSLTGSSMVERSDVKNLNCLVGLGLMGRRGIGLDWIGLDWVGLD